MMKRISALFLFFFFLKANAQIPSPEKFLGYKIGTRFTPHWKIVDYFRQLAAANPSMVKLIPYGETNEGRQLLVACISSAGNISKLEAIRTANLNLANQSGNLTAPAAPVIVWLSYNVHGNEASSSEASMLTAYALADPANATTAQWLQNTVVIIDPCLNPDGRDRYVNWYNSIAGIRMDPNPDAREHDEPWPGGRVNHYNFDLNRDWAWQTQVESRQRVALYNQWLPQIHVDFHEQGINSPYYFAPAAQPYHEVITKWQRDFQETIGRNNARYFDAAGWLYFTKEEFDLTYPAYGDTYPLYNGAIGMTYEQAGHSRAGLGIETASGDTLTLVDRALHHYTTSISTIEIASKNAARLVTEFRNFYEEAMTAGMGKYKSYLIKYSAADEQRINALLQLLDRNGIRYSLARSGTAKGFNYDTRKEESFPIAQNDILVSAYQPKSALVKVLFEPATFLSDTLAYDITAWSLPYAYGVKAYASTQRMDAGSNVQTTIVRNTDNVTSYGYVIPWSGMASARLVSQLVQQGIQLRYSEQAFESGGQQFDRGSVIVLKTGNTYQGNLWNRVKMLADSFQVKLTPVNSGFVDKGHDFGSAVIRPIKKRKIALFTGDEVSPNAAGEVWYYFEQELHYPVTLINSNNAGSMHWSDYDLVIMPDGNYNFLSDKTAADNFHNWISKGGQVIALEGAVGQLAKQDWSIRLKKEDTAETKDSYEALKKYENRERAFISRSIPGSILRVELDNSHPLAFGLPMNYYTLKTNDGVLEFIKDNGWNVGVIKKDRQVAGFIGSRLVNHLQDGLLFGTQEIGRGGITYLMDDVLFRSFWEQGKQLFANAVFLVGQ